MSNLILPAGGDDDYQISRSVRLRSLASAYFSRTPASAGNQKTWTWSGWVKRGALGAVASYETLFGQGTSTPASGYGFIRFDNNDVFTISSTPNGATSSIVWTSTPVYRDTSAYYHVLAVLDTTLATAADRFILYINGVRQSGSFSTTPTQNANVEINRASAHQIGASNASAVGNFFDGYLTEVHFIDGQALTPSSFGEFDTITGVWKPKKYTGTYGTNGFYLNFSDNSAATAAAIGKDYSGNGNNWTPNNISVTAGITNDSMIDVPTMWADGGNGRGNYAVLNPLSSNASMTIRGGNLNVTSSAGSQSFNAYSSIAVSTGKYYVEATINTGADADMIGVCPSTLLASSGRFDGLAGGVGYYRDGRKFIAGVATTYGASYTTGDVIGIALDMDAQTVAFYKNGVSQGTISSSLTAGVPYYFVTGDASASTGISQSWNFGQRPFAYTPPTGFKALNTQNLPEPLIKKGTSYFNVGLYSGNGSTQNLTQLGFQPDFVWNKSRANTEFHVLMDSVRTPDKALYSNATNAEDSGLGNTFTSTGMNVVSTGNINTNGISYVYWGWKKGATPGFDIVTGTSTGTTGTMTLAHSLGVAPAMVIAKNRDLVDSWYSWHQGLGASSGGYRVQLNQTNAVTTSTGIWGTGHTSSNALFGQTSFFSAAGQRLVAYLFAEVPGFSRFGSYTGNGSADGPFVYCGFRPRFVLVKGSSLASTWRILDTSINPFNVSDNSLAPNESTAEIVDNASVRIDILSNGFKIANTTYLDLNQNGQTYIFAAFAENPFKYSLAR